VLFGKLINSVYKKNRYDLAKIAHPKIRVMPKSRTANVTSVKEALLLRIQSGGEQRGSRFWSNRSVAAHYKISYQTAHRLLKELQNEGWLERKPASGTYLESAPEHLIGAQFIFNRRARRPGSFGASLLFRLRHALEEAGMSHVTTWDGPNAPILPKRFPILWEAPHATNLLHRRRQYSLILNQRPVPGLAATYVDSIGVDDLCGGVIAGELIRQRLKAKRSIAADEVLVVAGPERDTRNVLRVSGFLSVWPSARIIPAGGWYYANAFKLREDILKLSPSAIFCVNDRLAEAILDIFSNGREKKPIIIGFDNAPIAEARHLTTIAIPWAELARAVCSLAQARIAGDHSVSRLQLLVPRPVLRS
jgi:DNA-binding transcriptional regulator YhcF (GntR family)